jgi:hypothetical protein
MNSVWFNVEYYLSTHSTECRCTHYTLLSTARCFQSVCNSVTSWYVILFSTNSSPLVHPPVHFPPNRTRANPLFTAGTFSWHADCTNSAGYSFCTWQINFSLTYKLTISVAPASEDSSPYSQQTTTSSYTEPIESTRNPLANLPNIRSDPIFSTMPRTYDLTIFHGFSNQNLVHSSLLSHAPPTPFSTIWCA